jgi:hypothetical protein
VKKTAKTTTRTTDGKDARRSLPTLSHRDLAAVSGGFKPGQFTSSSGGGGGTGS